MIKINLIFNFLAPFFSTYFMKHWIFNDILRYETNNLQEETLQLGQKILTTEHTVRQFSQTQKLHHPPSDSLPTHVNSSCFIHLLHTTLLPLFKRNPFWENTPNDKWCAFSTETIRTTHIFFQGISPVVVRCSSYYITRANGKLSSRVVKLPTIK